MPTTEVKRKIAPEDYMIPEQGSPFQLINKTQIELPPASPIHQAICSRLIQKAYDFLDQENNKGFLAGILDVKFDDENILRPDVLYVSQERKAEIVKDWIEGAPDLVMEVLSITSAYYDIRPKFNVYQKFGVKEYILIDPICGNAELYVLKEGVYYLHQKAKENEVLLSLILPGFGIDLAKLFK